MQMTATHGHPPHPGWSEPDQLHSTKALEHVMWHAIYIPLIHSAVVCAISVSNRVSLAAEVVSTSWVASLTNGSAGRLGKPAVTKTLLHWFQAARPTAAREYMCRSKTLVCSCSKLLSAKAGISYDLKLATVSHGA